MNLPNTTIIYISTWHDIPHHKFIMFSGRKILYRSSTAIAKSEWSRMGVHQRVTGVEVSHDRDNTEEQGHTGTGAGTACGCGCICMVSGWMLDIRIYKTIYWDFRVYILIAFISIWHTQFFESLSSRTLSWSLQSRGSRHCSICEFNNNNYKPFKNKCM